MLVLNPQMRETDPQGDRDSDASKRLVLGTDKTWSPHTPSSASLARGRANPYPVS